MAANLATNSVDDVRRISMEAFLLYGDRRNYTQALEKLTHLKGVSFTIATLILSELDPVNIPYFTVSWQSDHP